LVILFKIIGEKIFVTRSELKSAKCRDERPGIVRDNKPSRLRYRSLPGRRLGDSHTQMRGFSHLLNRCNKSRQWPLSIPDTSSVLPVVSRRDAVIEHTVCAVLPADARPCRAA